MCGREERDGKGVEFAGIEDMEEDDEEEEKERGKGIGGKVKIENPC